MRNNRLKFLPALLPETAQETFSSPGHPRLGRPKLSPSQQLETNLVSLSGKLSAAHWAELNEIWVHDQRIPSLKSRKAWSKARGVDAKFVHAWFSRKRYNAMKKTGEVLPNGTYELDPEAPGSYPTLKTRKAETSSRKDISKLAKEKTELEVKREYIESSFSLLPPSVVKSLIGNERHERETPNTRELHAIKHTRAHEAVPHPMCLVCSQNFVPALNHSNSSETPSNSEPTNVSPEYSRSSTPGLTLGQPSSDLDFDVSTPPPPELNFSPSAKQTRKDDVARASPNTNTKIPALEANPTHAYTHLENISSSASHLSDAITDLNPGPALNTTNTTTDPNDTNYKLNTDMEPISRPLTQPAAYTHKSRRKEAQTMNAHPQTLTNDVLPNHTSAKASPTPNVSEVEARLPPMKSGSFPPKPQNDPLSSSLLSNMQTSASLSRTTEPEHAIIKSEIVDASALPLSNIRSDETENLVSSGLPRPEVKIEVKTEAPRPCPARKKNKKTANKKELEKRNRHRILRRVSRVILLEPRITNPVPKAKINDKKPPATPKLDPNSILSSAQKTPSKRRGRKRKQKVDENMDDLSTGKIPSLLDGIFSSIIGTKRKHTSDATSDTLVNVDSLPPSSDVEGNFHPPRTYPYQDLDLDMFNEVPWDSVCDSDSMLWGLSAIPWLACSDRDDEVV